MHYLRTLRTLHTLRTHTTHSPHPLITPTHHTCVCVGHSHHHDEPCDEATAQVSGGRQTQGTFHRLAPLSAGGLCQHTDIPYSDTTQLQTLLYVGLSAEIAVAPLQHRRGKWIKEHKLQHTHHQHHGSSRAARSVSSSTCRSVKPQGSMACLLYTPRNLMQDCMHSSHAAESLLFGGGFRSFLCFTSILWCCCYSRCC